MKPFCFSLSGIYESEGYAWEQAGKIWDLRELRGTDGYLDPETEQFLEAELGRKKETKELPRIRPSGFRQLSLYEQIAAGT
mgnify:CR=1 FL=1